MFYADAITVHGVTIPRMSNRSEMFREQMVPTNIGTAFYERCVEGDGVDIRRPSVRNARLVMSVLEEMRAEAEVARNLRVAPYVKVEG